MTLKSRAVSAFRWTAVSQLLAKLVTWAITLYVIRLLSPADYGLMALATVFIGLAGLLNDLGLNAALIQKRDLSDQTVAKIFGAVLLTNGALVAVLQILAGPIALFYDNETLEQIIRVLSAQLLIGSLASVPTAILMRDIAFRAVALIELIRSIVASFIVLALALDGWGVWALVLGAIAGALINTSLILLRTKFRMRPNFNLTGLGSELRFGALMVAKTLVSFFNRKIDVLLIGRLLGIDVVGAYSVAADLAKAPTRLLLRPVSRVSFPTAARLQDRPEQIPQMYLTMAGAASLIFFPLSWGMSALAEELVGVVLGQKWALAAPAIKVICLVIPLRAFVRLAQPILDGLGRPDIGLKNLVTTAICLPPALFFGSHWGLEGVVTGWALAYLASTAVNLRRSLPVLGVSNRAFAATVMPLAFCAGAMFALVSAAGDGLPDYLGPIQHLAVAAGAGALLYGLLVIFFSRDSALQAVKLLRR